MKKISHNILRLLLFIGIIYCSSSQLYGFLYPYETAVSECLKSIEITETETNVKGIDCIYVINLDIRLDKWQRVKSLFDEREMKVNRISGIYGKLIPKDTRIAMQGPYYPDHNLKPGEIGCLLSHVSCIKDAYLREFETIWIFEDDVEFLEDHHQVPILLQKLSKIDPDWDIFYTDTDWRSPEGGYIKNLGFSPRPGQHLPPADYYYHRQSVDHDILRIGQRYGMHSYIVSRKGMEKILNYYTHSYIWTSIDNDIHYIEEIRQYSSKKDLITNWRKTPYSDAAGSTFEGALN